MQESLDIEIFVALQVERKKGANPKRLATILTTYVEQKQEGSLPDKPHHI